MRRAGLAVALAALSLAPCGCGLLTLTHDQLIGPVSPAGRIHAVAVGEDFRVTDTGPEASLGDAARLRPYPRDLLVRLATPGSLYLAARGIQAFLMSISPIASREVQVGGDPPVLPPELQPGTSLPVALSLLGPPDLWLRRASGSFLVYRDASQRRWSFYIGVPPPAAVLVPIPGIANLRLRYVSERARADKLALFFDQSDRLVETRYGIDSATVPDPEYR